MFIIKEKHINRKTLASMPERSTYYKKYNDVSDVTSFILSTLPVLTHLIFLFIILHK